MQCNGEVSLDMRLDELTEGHFADLLAIPYQPPPEIRLLHPSVELPPEIWRDFVLKLEVGLPVSAQSPNTLRSAYQIDLFGLFRVKDDKVRIVPLGQLPLLPLESDLPGLFPPHELDYPPQT